jgi:hypothetical protein
MLSDSIPITGATNSGDTQSHRARTTVVSQTNVQPSIPTSLHTSASSTIPAQPSGFERLKPKFTRSPLEPFCFCISNQNISNSISSDVADYFSYSLEDPFLRYLTYNQNLFTKTNRTTPNPGFLSQWDNATKEINNKNLELGHLYEEIAVSITTDPTTLLNLQTMKNSFSRFTPREIAIYFQRCRTIVENSLMSLNQLTRDRLTQCQEELNLAHRSRLKHMHDYFIANTRLQVNNFSNQSNMKDRVKLACNVIQQLFDYRTILLTDSLNILRLEPLEQHNLVKTHIEKNLKFVISFLGDTLGISQAEIDSLLVDTRKDQEVFSQTLDDFRKLRILLNIDINYLGILQLIDEMVTNPDAIQERVSTLSEAIKNSDFDERILMFEFILGRKISPADNLMSLGQEIFNLLTGSEKLTSLREWIIKDRLNSKYALEYQKYNKIPNTINAISTLLTRIGKKIQNLPQGSLGNLTQTDQNNAQSYSQEVSNLLNSSMDKVQGRLTKLYHICNRELDLIRSTFQGRLDKVLQTALVSKGLIQAEGINFSGDDRDIAAIDINQPKRTIDTKEEGFMPISVSSIISADGFDLTNPHTIFNGSLYYSPKEFEQKYRLVIELSKEWYKDIGRVVKDPSFSWMQYPESFRQYLFASSVGDEPSTEKLLAYFRDHYEIKYAHRIQSRAYLESQLANDQEYIYGAPTAGYSTNLGTIIRSTENTESILTQNYKFFSKFNEDKGGHHWAHDPNWGTLVDVPIEIESSLRQLAESPLTMYSLAENLAPFVIYSPDYKPNNYTKYRWVSSIELLRLLTRKITNGIRDTHDLNWTILLDYDPSQETPEKYKRDYESFKKNPEELKNKDELTYTLMKVRNIWYEYFNNRMPNFAKHNDFKREIQRIAKEILNEEFIPYSERLAESPDWQDVYKNKIAKTISTVC